jgi:hypothetical protein
MFTGRHKRSNIHASRSLFACPCSCSYPLLGPSSGYDDLDSIQTVHGATMAHVQQPSSTLFTSPTMVNINSRLARESTIDSSMFESARQTGTSRSSLPPFIGQTPHAGKMLIVCFDGTGNDFNADNSNIVQLVSMLKKDDKTKQMVYYQVWLSVFRDSHSNSYGNRRLVLERTSPPQHLCSRILRPRHTR